MQVEEEDKMDKADQSLKDATFTTSDLAYENWVWSLAPREDDSILLQVGLDKVSKPNVAKDIGIIDVDTHLTEPADLWVSRAPAGLKDKMPYVKMGPNGTELWYLGDSPIGSIGYSVIDNKQNKLRGGKVSLPRFDEMHASAWDVKTRLGVMDQFGIAAQICYPNLGEAVRSDVLMKHTDKENALTIIRIFNEFRAEVQAQSGNRLFPLPMLPMWDQKTMMAEVRRCVEDHKMVGFNMPDRPELLGFPDWMSDFWQPMFEYLSEKKVPICFHVVSGMDFWALIWEKFSAEHRMSLVPTVFQMSHCVTVVNFLLSGLFDKYPGLRLFPVESGIGWIPFILESIDYQLESNGVLETAHLQRRPSEYFADHFGASFWFEKNTVEPTIKAIGSDCIMFETDYPHPTSLYPELHSHIDASLGGLDRTIVKKLLRDNAIRFFNLPLS